ncbi:uncharacterized protein LOC6551416 [Drosophila erecta]|uniref:Uncharacterized protein n=1 Tax=Drosophila erecta TaxID=7220 RepID=B3NVE1_DROER|nr:uncharacterized protein LOC6551416 [Drosophila erecta]EDV46129.1 uncharacterized protein Dere_GG18371 [Drosophila erecta]
MKPIGGKSIPVMFLVILGLVSLVSLASSLPMTPEQELKDVDEPLRQQPQQQVQRMVKSEAVPDSDSESEFVGRIAPHNEQNPEDVQEYDAVTLVEELEAAGVQLAGRQDLRKLTYTELVRLLALWHLSQNRNVYNAKGPEEQPNQAIDEP